MRDRQTERGKRGEMEGREGVWEREKERKVDR